VSVQQAKQKYLNETWNIVDCLFEMPPPRFILHELRSPSHCKLTDTHSFTAIQIRSICVLIEIPRKPSQVICNCYLHYDMFRIIVFRLAIGQSVLPLENAPYILEWCVETT
jgi:hypothetical protein